MSNIFNAKTVEIESNIDEQFVLCYVLSCDYLILRKEDFDPDNIAYSKYYGCFDLYEADDTMLFKKANRELSFLKLNIPNKNIRPEKYSFEKAGEGIIKLKQDIDFFSIKNTHVKFFDPDNNVLLCKSGKQASFNRGIQLNKDFYLLFFYDTYIGWMLNNASFYLADTFSSLPALCHSSVISHFLSDFLKICDDENIDLLEDREDSLKKRILQQKRDLTKALDEITWKSEKQSIHILLHALQSILDTFYGD